MQSPPSTGTSAPSLLTALAPLWFAGVSARITILAVPPVIPLIHGDLHMTETQVGLLMSFPVLMFALAAIPGSLLIARTGASRIAIAGLLIIACASAARAAASNIWLLYAATALMGAGIAILQPALPTLVRNWASERVGFGSAVSTNGMMVGAMAGPVLTIPFILPAVGQSWRMALLVWTAPVVVAALLFLTIAPRDRQNPGDAMGTGARRWWPDWKNPLLWLLALTLGSNNAFYFAINAFLPDYLNSRGEGALIGAALGGMNGMQLIASFVLLVTAERMQRQTWPYLVFGVLPLAGVLAIIFGSAVWIVAGATVVGFSLAVTFVMTFALPPLLSPPDQVHRMAGGMFTISYTIGVIVPVLCGALWDLTGLPWMVFLPIGVIGVALTALGYFLSMRAASTKPTSAQGDR